MGIKYNQINYKRFPSFELCIVKVSLENKKSSILVCVYRILFVSFAIFLEEIVELFEMLASSNESMLLAGDMNICWEKDELYSNRFKAILHSFKLIQYVVFPTHKMWPYFGYNCNFSEFFDNFWFTSK